LKLKPKYLGELAKMIYRISPVKQLCMARPAGREIDRNQYARELKTTNAIRKTLSYTEHDKR
jgi:hypothetical protein